MGEFKNELIIEMINRKQGQVTPEGSVGYALGLSDMFDKIAGDRKASEWISVKDELPKKQGHYLVYCPCSFPKNYRGVVAEFYEDNKIFYDEACENPIEDATHWMELPEEPKN